MDTATYPSRATTDGDDEVQELPPTRPVLDLHPPMEGERRYLNRELTWLSFNERVLRLAADVRMPLLERVKFIAIFTSNLDEFFQVRIAGLLEQVESGGATPPPDGMTPQQQLAAARSYAGELVAEQGRLVQEELLPVLAAEGIHLPRWADLTPDDRAHLTAEFEHRVFPVLTPLAVDPAHPFPYISDLSLNLAVQVRDPITGETRFARVKVPPILPRFVAMPDGTRFVPLEQIIAAHLDRLFPGLEIVDHHPFRVTRNADVEIEEDEADDLLRAIEDELTRRRFGSVVRLEVEPDMPDSMRQLLQRELAIGDEAVEVVHGPLDLTGMWAFVGVDRPDLKLPSFTPVTPPELTGANDVFEATRRGDVLLQHPYDSFATTVQRFLEEAAADPAVLAIKTTLYRTSGPESPIVRALLRAAAEGKQVVALVELKARFDEEANIEWARVLEEAGVHVAYGVVGLKTHTKLSLVVRDDGDAIRRYCHIGTGNYNERTARLYEDLGLLTADPDLGADLSDLFNVLTGYSRQSTYRRLLVAPTSLSPRILELIREEAAHGPDGHITLKMNSLVDVPVIDALYDAAQAGCRVEIIVRGICCLRSGVPGMSDGIQVRSVVGRYLEHSRIYRFGTSDRDRTYLIGSADLMPRNLYRRVEAVTPIEAAPLRRRIDEVLQTLMSDDTLAWDQAPDGSWSRVPARHDDTAVETHRDLQAAAQHRVRPRRVEDVVEELPDASVRAAGGVVVRPDEAGTPEVLVVHRPRYDDWSLPKGKLDAGESWADAAQREVMEETGVPVVLDRELSPVAYTDRDGNPKTVRWWLMHPQGDGTPLHSLDREVDEARWVSVDAARDLLSYDTDRALLDELPVGVVLGETGDPDERGELVGPAEGDERRDRDELGRGPA